VKRRDLDDHCLRAMRRHLEAGGERTLADAYELGRWALTDGIGVLDVSLALQRAARVLRGAAPEDEHVASRLDTFILDVLSPYEMALSGAREANHALRRLDARHEDTVRRIARELHDEAGQLLATVHLALDQVRPHLAPGGEERLARAVELLHRAENEIRRLSHELRPSLLDDLGLMPALRFLAEGVTKRSGIAVTVIGSEDGRVPGPIETAIYRAAQEALHNIARHARATRAILVVERAEDAVCFEVRDDGRGFDPNSLAARRGARGFGLSGIRERIAPFGGRLEIRSSPRRGTALMIRIPLEASHVGSVAAGR
jgi:signal transduction histidine kinase